MLKKLNAEVQELQYKAKELYKSMDEKFKAAGDKDYDGIAADREQLEKMVQRGEQLRAEIDKLRKAEELIKGTGEVLQESRVPMQLVQRPKTVGELVVESEQFKVAAKNRNLDRVEVKDLLTGTPAAGGYLVPADRDDRVRFQPLIPVAFIDLVMTLTTNSNMVEIIQETSPPVANLSLVVPEGTDKPEGNMTFALLPVPIVVIAEYMTASRQILEDAPRIRGYIDGRLRIHLREKIESLMINGDGVGGNFSGLTVVAGTTQRTQSVASNGLGAAMDSVLDTLRYAMADLETSFFTPRVVMINAINAAKLEVQKGTDGHYMDRYDPVTSRIWRVPAVISHHLINTKAIVIDTMMSCELYLRNEVAIYTGQPTDYFVKNLFAILAEVRAGFGVPYPKGIVEVTLT
jgi:HK97 family phage major capsid protein